MRNTLKIVIIFIIGIGGGIFADRVVNFYQISKIHPVQSPSRTIEKREIRIEENTALQDAVEKIQGAIVGVKTRFPSSAYKGKEKIISGSGLIITSDGLMVTLAELVPQGKSFSFFIDGKEPKYQVLKRNLKDNLALIKLEGSGFQTCGFVDFGKVRLGERVFLVGAFFQNENSPVKLVNEGIIKYFNEQYIQTNILEKSFLEGSPLFNIKGELLGLNTIDKEGRVFSIPITKIRSFVGL